MIYNIRITIWMLRTITKRLEICIDINISKADHLWIFTSRIFRIAWKKVSGVGVAYLGPRVYHDVNRVRTILLRGTKLSQKVTKKLPTPCFHVLMNCGTAVMATRRTDQSQSTNDCFLLEFLSPSSYEFDSSTLKPDFFS